jgi:hypothetical protein
MRRVSFRIRQSCENAIGFHRNIGRRLSLDHIGVGVGAVVYRQAFNPLNSLSEKARQCLNPFGYAAPDT